MMTIPIKIIAIIIAFSCHQTVITMMISNSFSIKRCKEIKKLLAYKRKLSQSFQKIDKQSSFILKLSNFQCNNSDFTNEQKKEFLQIILPKTKFKPKHLKYNLDTLIDSYKNINNLEEFKKIIIDTLLINKNFSIQGIFELLYNNSNEQCMNKEQKLVDYILKNYKNNCKSITIYKPPLNCGEFEIRFWDFCGRDECIILKTIIKAAKEENFVLVDFLIRPQTVNLLKEYIAYNPNNLWKEFLKDHATYFYNKNKKVCERFKKWSDNCKIRKKQEIIKLLIKYNYIENISKFTYTLDNCNGFQTHYQSNYNFMSPLHVACRMNNEKILNLLLQHMKKDPNTLNSAINSLDGEAQPPIYYASRGDVELINMLIEAGADYHSCPFVAIALLYKTIDTLDQLNFFNQLTKHDKNVFIQQQLYLLALTRPAYLVKKIGTTFRQYKCLKDNQELLNEKINKILDFFLFNGADFNKRNETGELSIDIALQQYKLDVKIQEDFKKENSKDWAIDCEQLYILFAFFRKTNVINYGLLYLSLKESILKDILKPIMEFYYFLTFDIEKEIYRSYAQKYTPQAIDKKFQNNKSDNFAKKLHIAINNKINEKYKKLAKKPIGS